MTHLGSFGLFGQLKPSIVGYMKVLALTLAILPLSLTQASADARLDRCRHAADMAYEIMLERQRGRPMADMVAELSRWPERYRDLARAMVKRAFERPRYPSESSQEFDAEVFRDATFSVCYDGKGAQK